MSFWNDDLLYNSEVNRITMRENGHVPYFVFVERDSLVQLTGCPKSEFSPSVRITVSQIDTDTSKCLAFRRLDQLRSSQPFIIHTKDISSQASF